MPVYSDLSSYQQIIKNLNSVAAAQVSACVKKEHFMYNF